MKTEPCSDLSFSRLHQNDLIRGIRILATPKGIAQHSGAVAFRDIKLAYRLISNIYYNTNENDYQ